MYTGHTPELPPGTTVNIVEQGAFKNLLEREFDDVVTFAGAPKWMYTKKVEKVHRIS